MSTPPGGGVHTIAPSLQEFFDDLDRIACVHMSGLLMRSHMNAVTLDQRRHGGSRTLDHHLAKIPAPALRSSPGGGLARHEAQSGDEVAPLVDSRRGHQCGRIQRTDAGNGCQPTRPVVGPGHGYALSVEGGDALIQFLPARPCTDPLNFCSCYKGERSHE